MANTINLLPVRTKDQIRGEILKFKYDFYTALIIMGVVVVGIIIMFINAFFTYADNNVQNNINTAQNTLNTYKSLAVGYSVVDKKATQAKHINDAKTNPTDVLNYMNTLLPSNFSLSNFSLSSANTFTVTITSSDYISVAKFLVQIEDPKIRLKGSEIKQIQYDHTQNIINFVISGVYTKNG